MLTRIRSPFSLFPGSAGEFDQLWQVMFHTFPSEGKPPLVVDVYGDEPSEDSDQILNPGVIIQLAVAGYTNDQLKVYSKNNTLIVEGDNMEAEDVPDKFKSRFKRLFPCKDTVALENTSVDLLNGILTIKVPFHQPKEEVKRFF